ncbi:MAG: CDP-alcohol phosphatidyltransferase family protein [Rickettsiales bacterium]|nr:CDP-alcohol phosphatidyltransferase family protein [Rickettsiales bacterium]
MMNKIKYLIPSVITFASLIFGMLSLFFVFNGKDLSTAICLVCAAAICDAMDGRAARLLKVNSAFGVELDSLADFFNFGVVPIMIYFVGYNWANDLLAFFILMLFPLGMITRLARFNVDATNRNVNPKIKALRSKFFFGLPAPIGAFVLLVPVILDISHLTFFYNPTSALLYAVAIAFWLVAPIPGFSPKGYHIGFNTIRNTVFTAFVVVLGVILFISPAKLICVVALFYLASIPFAIYSYNQGLRKINNVVKFKKRFHFKKKRFHPKRENRQEVFSNVGESEVIKVSTPSAPKSRRNYRKPAASRSRKPSAKNSKK